MAVLHRDTEADTRMKDALINLLCILVGCLIAAGLIYLGVF